MTQPGNDFHSLLKRVQAGCPDAAKELYQRYSSHVRRVVRHRLHERMRPLYDSGDFMQSIWTSFFTLPKEKCSFDTPSKMLGFLVTVAYNKVVERYRERMLTAKRDLRREQGLPRMPDGNPADLPGPHPTPSQFAIADECWERMLEGQTPQHRRILEMLRLGHTQRAIAAQLGVHVVTIERLLKRLEDRLEP